VSTTLCFVSVLVRSSLDTNRSHFRSHDHVFVGTFNIPPLTVSAMSITDMMIVASFSPDKWDALSLTAEYYQGKLILTVDAQATVRVPFLADYSFTTEMKNLIVHVNQQSDRHLCACPSWVNPNKTLPTFLKL
jgi:hypothetical protein